ncbi:MAG: hypothetical protein Q9217_002776 [Psora testacea]
MASTAGCARLLFVDAYDSFTNNIISLLETQLDVHATVIKLDEKIEDLAHFVEPFAAIVLGPGPGDPRNHKDVGLFRRFWQLSDEHLVPILGICLGFQSMVLAFGGHVEQLHEPRHGFVRRIRHDGQDIFEGLDQLVEAVQYHSLHAILGDLMTIDPTASNAQFHQSCQRSADLTALAWDSEIDNKPIHPHILTQNPPFILMAVRHKNKPFHGLQFHPESICSSSSAQDIILNWWRSVRRWWVSQPARANQRDYDYRPECLFHNECGDISSCNAIQPLEANSRPSPIITKIIPSTSLTVPSICSRLGLGKEVIVLDSENHQRAEVGQHSIIGITSPGSLRFEFNIGTSFVRRMQHGQTTKMDLLRKYGGDVFQFLRDFIRQRRARSMYTDIPFWGGLIGYINYENCLETIGVSPLHGKRSDRRTSSAPDFNFIFVERSLVIAHVDQKIYVQSLTPNDHDWVGATASILTRALPASPPPSPFPFLNASITLPHEPSYKAKIRTAQSHIRAGNSYEICLTTRATIRTPTQLPSWPLYLRLRQLNPAPFAAHIRLGGLTLLSSSPERFLSWKRPSGRRGIFGKETVCQFRPIKGTIARRPDPTRPELTLKQAEGLLATPKEKAENLMIVDLIRHDLHGVVGSGNVSVPKLMIVEEYKTLFQLVSVVEGVLHIPGDSDGENSGRGQRNTKAFRNSPHERTLTDQPSATSTGEKSGIDVLAASLPPGSMTGAPKLRSCQLLQRIENRPRGVYSGVVGYLDVGGGGDFSVVIRSVVRWDGGHAELSSEFNKSQNKREEWEASSGRSDTGDTWTIGAGGAITALSTEESEYEEMMTKLRSTLRLFEDETTIYD